MTDTDRATPPNYCGGSRPHRPHAFTRDSAAVTCGGDPAAGDRPTVRLSSTGRDGVLEIDGQPIAARSTTIRAAAGENVMVVIELDAPDLAALVDHADVALGAGTDELLRRLGWTRGRAPGQHLLEPESTLRNALPAIAAGRIEDTAAYAADTLDALGVDELNVDKNVPRVTGARGDALRAAVNAMHAAGGGVPEGTPVTGADAVLAVLDELAELFKARPEVDPYHAVRAYAHDHGMHLTGCTHGIGYAPEGARYELPGAVVVRSDAELADALRAAEQTGGGVIVVDGTITLPPPPIPANTTIMGISDKRAKIKPKELP